MTRYKPVAHDSGILPGFQTSSILIGRRLLAEKADNLPEEDRLLGLLIAQHHFWFAGLPLRFQIRWKKRAENESYSHSHRVFNPPFWRRPWIGLK